MRECKLCKLTSYMSIQEMLCWENVMFSILNTGSFIHLYVHVCACIITRGIRVGACEVEIVFAPLSCCVCALQHIRESNESQGFQNLGQQLQTPHIPPGLEQKFIHFNAFIQISIQYLSVLILIYKFQTGKCVNML